MTAYPLQSVLELRRREEKEAMARFANATRSREAVEAEGRRLAATLELAREKLGEAAACETSENRNAAALSVAAGRRSSRSATETLAHARFVERRREEVKRARAALTEFREGPLRRARDAETAARDRHQDVRRAREALEKHFAKHQAAAKASADRREEEMSEDIARAARHRREQL